MDDRRGVSGQGGCALSRESESPISACSCSTEKCTRVRFVCVLGKRGARAMMRCGVVALELQCFSFERAL